MPSKKRAPPAEPLMHAIYCHRYYMKNREQLNEKTRERMRRLRALDVTVPPEVLATRLEARRATARGYRERNQWKLKMKARVARAAAAEERRQAKEHQERKEKRAAARQEAARHKYTPTPFSTTDSSVPQHSAAEARDARCDIQGLTPSRDAEHARNRACIEEAGVRCEDGLRLRRHLHRFNSFAAAWERFQVYNFFGALRLAMALQIAHDLRCVVIDTP
ncbi:hypothetical protein B0H11DRAFT_1944494 [Mycena galericulata]|nr:hypothetical protein B0H11DRAFT_1944494 [Mycena galericulata]